MTMPSVMTALASALIVITVWLIRSRARTASNARVRQLRAATQLYTAHGEALDRFLGRKTAPGDLKQLAMTLSEAMEKNIFVNNLTQRLCGHAESQADPEVTHALEALRTSDPEGFADFMAACLTGAYAGILRWPETASFYEQIATNIVVNPKRDIDVVITASKFQKSDLPTEDHGSPLAIA